MTTPWLFRSSQLIPSLIASPVETSRMRASSTTCRAGTSMTRTISSICEMTRGLVTTISRLPPLSTWMFSAMLRRAALTSSALAYLRSTT